MITDQELKDKLIQEFGMNPDEINLSYRNTPSTTYEHSPVYTRIGNLTKMYNGWLKITLLKNWKYVSFYVDEVNTKSLSESPGIHFIGNVVFGVYKVVTVQPSLGEDIIERAGEIHRSQSKRGIVIKLNKSWGFPIVYGVWSQFEELVTGETQSISLSVQEYTEPIHIEKMVSKLKTAATHPAQENII